MRRSRAGAVTVATLLLAAAGCRAVPEAPESLDGLLHYFWQTVVDGGDDEIAQGVVNLNEAVDGDGLTEITDGQATQLTADEVAWLELDREVDPTEASGIHMISPLTCDLETVDDIVTALPQGEMYDTFDEYERRYTSDAGDYHDRSVPTLTWTVDYTVTVPLAGTYTATLDAGARWVPTLDDTLSPHGPVLITWSTLPEPAVFDGGEGVFDQDYRVEVYHEPEPGKVVHTEALWRYMEAGVVSMSNESIQRMVLNGFADWDAQTVALCQSGDF